MRRLIPIVLLVTVLPVRAGLFDDDVARARIEKLQSQAADLTQRMEVVSKNQMDFANQMEAVQAELAKIRGQLEVLTYELEATQKRQKDFYVDLDNRLRKLEPQAAAATDTAPAAAQPPADPAAETRSYEAALTALKASKFKEAGEGFAAFIKAFPASTLLPSAHFWGGYSLARAKEPARAAELLAKFAATWPTDPRAPDALLEQASALEATGNGAEARKVLEALVDKFPASEAAKQAKPRLKKKK